ncbi:MAG: ABC transporter permease [Anaerolineales bacterium]|nr:ABC transporter permease [Anaerolineales bacterium]
MKNTFLVARFEFQSILSKRSFWITTFILPILILGLTFGSQLLFSASEHETSAERGTIPGIPAKTGLVDPAGLLSLEETSEIFIHYPNEEEARAALRRGEIETCLLLQGSSIESGQVDLIVREYSPLKQISQTALMETFLDQNLVTGTTMAELLSDPMGNVQMESLLPGTESGGTSSIESSSFLVPYLILFLFFMMISISSGMALRAVSKEKENNTAEILLVCLRPRELLSGKLIGLSAITLLQILIWFLVLKLGSRQPLPFLDLPAGFQLPNTLILWGIPFLMAGFLMYGSALIVLGVLAPTAREGTQFTFMVYLPLMVPMMLNSLFVTAPQSPLVTFLSLFPPTAPLSMVTRLTIVPVPLWELVGSLAGVLLAAGLLLHTASQLFRADTLLSSASLNFKRLLTELLAVLRPGTTH